MVAVKAKNKPAKKPAAAKKKPLNADALQEAAMAALKARLSTLGITKRCTLFEKGDSAFDVQTSKGKRIVSVGHDPVRGFNLVTDGPRSIYSHTEPANVARQIEQLVRSYNY